MAYYAKISGNMLTVRTEQAERTLPIGEQLLDFMYTGIPHLGKQLDAVLERFTSSKRPVVRTILMEISDENTYLYFFAEYLLEILSDKELHTENGFERICSELGPNVQAAKRLPRFSEVNYETANTDFWKTIILFGAFDMHVALRARFEFCMNVSNSQAMQGLQPMQRLYLFEKWQVSKRDQPIYFTGEHFATKLLVDKKIVFPRKGSLEEWAELLKQENPVISEMTEVYNGFGLMRYELMHMVMQDVQIKLCANCERYFINTGRSDKEYCARPVDGQPGKTCEDVGAQIKHQNKVKNSDVIQEYNTAYKRANSNKRIGNLTEKEFKAWSKEARVKRDLCLAGKLLREEFTEWLNQDRIYRKRD